MTKRVRFLNCKREAAGLVRCSGCLFQFHAAKDTTSCPGCGAGVLIDCPGEWKRKRRADGRSDDDD